MNEKDKIITFLKLISHELRTPMVGVVSALEILQNETKITPKQKEYLDIALTSSKSLLQIVNDLLDLSLIKQNTFQIEENFFSLDDFIKETFSDFKKISYRKKVSFLHEVDEDLKHSYIYSDKNRLKQVINNFLSNAYRFTSERGQITLIIKKVKKLKEKYVLRFCVKDTGAGISEEDLEHIFDPFEQADDHYNKRYKGTGLGLTICKKITDLLGGGINAKSKMGKGSSFYIDLPVKILFDEESNQNFSVLVVEDNPVNQLVIKKFISDYGDFIVDVVDDGKKALHKLVNKKYDLILLDIQLPELDGIEVCKRIRKKDAINEKTPIVAISAFAYEQDKINCIQAGMNDFITKPINADNFNRVIQQFIEI